MDDDGQRKGIESNDVNDYLREICSESFTAKDFRTWAGTVLTACELSPVSATPIAGSREEKHRAGH